jgi:hypothetical protein
MRIPSRVTTTRRRHATQLAPAHRKIPYRLTRSWSAIACMRLVDATDCLRCEARAVNKSLVACAKCLHGQTLSQSNGRGTSYSARNSGAQASLCRELSIFRARWHCLVVHSSTTRSAAGILLPNDSKNETRFLKDFSGEHSCRHPARAVECARLRSVAR